MRRLLLLLAATLACAAQVQGRDQAIVGALAGVTNLGRVHAVMKGGTMMPAAAILAGSQEAPTQRNPDVFGTPNPEDSPEAVVQRQLEAYNAHDVDAFLATYDPDIEMFTFPGERTAQGLEQMRTTYAALFERIPDLQAEIRSRIVHGRYVIDHEVVTGASGGVTIEAVAIYEVRDGRIRRVWFIQ